MSSYRTRRLDRSTAERLLAGEQAITHTKAATTTAMLAMVLRAAAAPAHPEELAGEHRALAAYLDAYLDAAQLGPVTETRRPSMLKSALAKALTVKAAIVVAALGASGVALAAGTGALPTPWSGNPSHPPASSRAADPSTSSDHSTGRPSDAGKPTDASGTPSPSMTGLCNAYAAKDGEERGKALDSPAFEALITAAGGRDNVSDYCDDLTKKTGKPSDLPTPTDPGKDSDHGNAPSTRPAPETNHTTPSNRPVTPGASHPAEPSGGATPPHQGG